MCQALVGIETRLLRALKDTSVQEQEQNESGEANAVRVLHVPIIALNYNLT